MRQPVEVDAAQIVVATAATEVREDFLARLTTRAGQLIEGGTADAGAQASLRTYLTGLWGSR